MIHNLHFAWNPKKLNLGCCIMEGMIHSTDSCDTYMYCTTWYAI